MTPEKGISHMPDIRGSVPGVLEKIENLKRKLKGSVVVLGHHYQRPEIVALSDFVGDSFLLARKASGTGSRWIIFCGVRFMAEAAAILSRENQRVLHPDPYAGCPMADMASLEEASMVWDKLEEICGPGRFLPVVYMNSSAELKAFAGERGGLVCTSSNAWKAFSWVLGRGKRVFFLPDEHLGRNTARTMGIDEQEIAVYDFTDKRGGLSEEKIREAKILLWSGHCHVHIFFKEEHILQARKNYPGCRIIVHPETPVRVAELADEMGSTEKIARYVKESKDGSVIVVGTEINMVKRLAMTFPGKTIVPLARSLCPNMYRITPSSLLKALESIERGARPLALEMDENIRTRAKAALSRMLELGSSN